MTEIIRLGFYLNSVAPDFERRPQRACDLTKKIVEIKSDQPGKKTFDEFKTSEIAQKLGVYEKLGVTESRVVQGIGPEDLKE